MREHLLCAAAIAVVTAAVVAQRTIATSAEDADQWPATQGGLEPAAAGAEAARRLGLLEGSTLQLGGATVRVLGIAETAPAGLNEALFVPLPVAQRLLGRPGQINALERSLFTIQAALSGAVGAAAGWALAWPLTRILSRHFLALTLSPSVGLLVVAVAAGAGVAARRAVASMVIAADSSHAAGSSPQRLVLDIPA